MKLSIYVKFALNFSVVFLLVAFSGCATRPVALPQAHADKIPWGAIDLDIRKEGAFTLRGSLGRALKKKTEGHNLANNEGDVHSNDPVPFNILTLSGGGTRGAFGAGLISGWAESGNIPEFDIVTGVSTGAVMATFVFLGGDELDKAEWFYTKSHTDDVYTPSWLSFFGEAYLMNPAPLKALFKKTFNKALLDKVAVEHAKGRRFYVGTTNLDTGEFVVWDMGAIASSSRGDKYQRFADIIYASSAMPIFLPPQYIGVDIEGESFYQMHVDGGIHSHVFMVGLLVNWREVLNLNLDASKHFDTTLYVVANRKYRNRHLYSPVEQSPSSIIAAYIEMETDLLFDRNIYRLYISSMQKNIKFRMAAVPKYDNNVDDSTVFDPVKMTRLFNVGYQYGVMGINWKEEISINEYDNR